MSGSETRTSKTSERRSDPRAKPASAGVLGVALAATALTGLFAGSAFAMQPLAQGYLLGASHAGAEGKCGRERGCCDESMHPLLLVESLRCSRRLHARLVAESARS